MAASLISLGRTAGANEVADGTVPSAVAKFYAAAETEGGKASVWLARASLDLARCFPADRGDQAWNVSAAHRYGVSHTVKGVPLHEAPEGAVPLVRVARRQFARYVDAGAALVAAGHTAREVPTDAEVDTVKRSLGIAYGAAERDQSGRTRTARPNAGADDKPADDKPADKPSGKRADEVKAPAGNGVPVPTLSTFDQMIAQIAAWERAITRDQVRLRERQPEKLLDAVTSLMAAVSEQESRATLADGRKAA